MKLRVFHPCILGLLGTVIAIPSMFGNLLSPGTTVAPDVFTTSSGFTVLATTGPININPVPGNSFNGTYTETVVRDANNVFCANCLDFLIMASNAGPGIFERISTSSFDSFLTDVGYNTSGPAGILPDSIDRSANGNVIGFNFIPPGTSVNSGQNTVLLQIQTNAVSYQPGFVSIQDGVSGFGAGFQPASVPEPASMALLGAGLLVFGFAKKKLRGGPQRT